jgi:hypothetical protein
MFSIAPSGSLLSSFFGKISSLPTLHVRQKGDFRSKAIKRVEGAGTDARGRYVCIGSGFAHGIEGDAGEGVENDDDRCVSRS